MRVSLLFIGIPPPVLFQVENRGLKKSMGRAPVGARNQAKSGQIRLEIHPCILLAPYYIEMLINNLNSPVVGAGPSAKG